MRKKLQLLKGAVAEARNLFEVPPSIQLFTNRQAVIQGARGIIEYTDELVRVSYGDGEARFFGSELCISCLSRDSLEILGKIERLEYV